MIEYKDSKRIVALEADTATTEEVYNYTTTQSTYNKLTGTPTGYSCDAVGVELVSSIFAGKYIKTGKWMLKRVGTLGSNAFMKVQDSSGTVKATSAGVAASGISNSAYEYVTFTLPTAVELANGDRVYVEYLGADTSGDYLSIGEKHPSTTPTGWEYTIYNVRDVNGNNPSGVWGDDGLPTALVPVATFDSAPSSNKPTDVQDNSILVEKDTARRYWFSESGTTINFPPTTTQTEFTTQGTPDDMVFSQDGLHLYTVDGTGALSLGEYTLTTAWDISTASHTRNKSFSYGSLSGVSINNDGTKIYVVDYTTQKCHQLDLSTAYNISTATDNGVWKYVTGGTGNVPTGIHFKPDGTRAYVVDQNPDQLTSYTLSTAWDLSTLSYDSVSKSLSSQNPEGMIMNYTGTKIWVLYNSNDTVQEWTLSTAWDLSTATANATTWDFSAVANILSGGDTNPDDSTIYFLNSTGKVLEYPPTPATWAMKPTLQDDFSSSTGWTTVGSNISITGGAITASAMVTQTDNRIYYDLGSALSDKFVIDFDHYADSSPVGSYWQMFALTDTTAIPRNDDSIYPLIDMGSWDVYLRYTNEGNAEVNVGTLGSLTTGQWQYVRFVRDGTTGTLTVYSDSARTTQVLNVSGTIPATVTGLRYFQSGALASANTGTATYKIDNLKIYDGVTSIN